MKQADITPFPLRLQPNVREQVRRLAYDRHWSANTFIRVAVEEKIQRDLRDVS